MKVLLIDDRGNTKEAEYDSKTFEQAREDLFFPCGECGEVVFEEEWGAGKCKRCEQEQSE